MSKRRENMEIRYLLETDDMMKISDIYEQSWKCTYKGIIPQKYLDSIPKGKWVSNTNIKRMNNIILKENDEIIGTACFGSSRWKEFKEYGEIVSIYLLPGFTGRGYGRKLIEKALYELGKMGYEQVLLWVLEENTNARMFYEHIGFINSGHILEDNIGGKALREIMYTKTTCQEQSS